MCHVGWRNDKTVLCYIKLSKILSVGDALSALSSCDPDDNQFELFSDLNSLKLFSDAFPSHVLLPK